MSPLTRQMWLDAWSHLDSAKQSFEEAKTPEDKERSLCDMILLSDVFKSSCLSFAGSINYEKLSRKKPEQ